MTIDIDKDQLLKESKVFCMLPWIHLYVEPTGAVLPCCISNPKAVANYSQGSLTDLVNSPKMNALRLTMLSEVKNKFCSKCYELEDIGVQSFRQQVNRDYERYFIQSVSKTKSDGSLKEFKMRYFDIRFNNICNFKCRTCAPEYSSLWEQEFKKTGKKIWFEKVEVDPRFLKETIEQVKNIDAAYFAGGEPLIAEEHYLMLEEMIRQNRTDIRLRYNTNLSNLKFKNKDLLGLWKHFNKPIEVYASIDHYGERAEYIRHGSKWDLIESNYLTIKKQSNINIQINTVLSIFNVLTFNDFIKYLIEHKLYSPGDWVNSIYNLSNPSYLSCGILPDDYQEQAKNSLTEAIALMKSQGFKHNNIKPLENALTWVSTYTSSWKDNKQQFQTEIRNTDAIRNENFEKVFPELSELML